jgi:hypothetical protein
MLADWNRWFSDCDPIGHHLRVAHIERWIRFHSLPESKRYSEDETEIELILERHNCVLEGLAKGSEKIVLLTTGYSDCPDLHCRDEVFSTLDPHASLWRTIAMDQVDVNFQEPTYWHVFASEWQWRPRVFDPVVRLVASGVLANIMIVANDCRWLLHPYDGGMDVILDSTKRRNELKAKYGEWISATQDGL